MLPTIADTNVFLYSSSDNSDVEAVLRAEQVPFRRSSAPLKDALLSVGPVCLILDTKDQELISFCKFCTQSVPSSVLTTPCGAKEIKTAIKRLNRAFEPWLTEKLRDPSFDVPTYVMSLSVAATDLISEERVAELRKDALLDSTAFNVCKYTPDELVIVCALLYERAAKRLGLHIPFSRLVYMGLVMRACYGFRGYHCFRHVIDVAQYVSFLDSNGLNYFGTDTRLSPLDGAALVVCALGHDLLHPNVTTTTVKDISPKWGEKYRSLEEFHYTVYARLLEEILPEIFIEGMSQAVVDLVAATEMIFHNDYLHRQFDDTPTGRRNYLCLVMKLADIGNVSRVFDASLRQTVHLGIEIAHEKTVRATAMLDGKDHYISSAKPFGKTREDVWKRTQQDQLGFAKIFFAPILERLMEDTNKHNVELFNQYKKQFETTVASYNQETCPQEFFFLIDYLLAY